MAVTTERKKLEGEEEIRKLQTAAELRCMALASFYKQLQLNENQLKEVESDLRKARMYELLTVSTAMRRAELDQQRRYLAEEEKRMQQRQQQRVVQSQQLRQRALCVIQQEADAVSRESKQLLADDRRLLLQHEKEKLLARRRQFEADGSSSQSPAVGGAGGPPVLVMNVALGNGREDKLVVRALDDPKSVAQQFVRKHHLPDHTVGTLTSQIRTNLSGSVARANSPSPSVGTPRRAVSPSISRK